MENQLSHLPITREQFRLLKYLYRSRNRSAMLSDIERKFGHDALSHFISFCSCHLCAYIPPNSPKYTFEITNTAYNGRYTLTIEGEKYVEDRIFAFRAWLLPVLLSSISLLFSFFSLFIV